MLNIEVAQDSFWQFARFWKNGEDAKLEMSCKNGLLELNISAKIGHPDHLHFPPPPHVPAPIIRSKSPSQLRRQVRRQQERAEEAPNVDKTQSNEIQENEAEEELNVAEINISTIAAVNPVETKTNISPTEKFKCEHCDFENENCNLVSVHVMNLHPETFHPTETSLLKPPLKKQDFGGYAHPPYETSFTHCLLRGAGCSSKATKYISNAKLVIANQVRQHKHIYTCNTCTKYISPVPGSKFLPVGSQ